MIGTAGALGDAGSLASDSTLGPTMGIDGQHNHIRDTCVPTLILQYSAIDFRLRLAVMILLYKNLMFGLFFRLLPLY
ncbi:MAG: Na+/H+ antiporter NhaC family protein [Paenisporosarcina sp.]